MDIVRAWIKRTGEGTTCSWRVLTKALENRGITFSECACDREMPGLFLIDCACDKVIDELTTLRQKQLGPIIIVTKRRPDLNNRDFWSLLEAGAADVLVLEECRDPGAAVLARLQRISEIEKFMRSPVVTENLIGNSEVWHRSVREVIETARFASAPLLITGESGTGKELVARLVHTLDTRPDKGKLVVLDCTTVVPSLSGSEFFGHERGAFTSAVSARDGAFALAHKGTLFLDEVGELPLALQAELLRVVQEHTYKRVGGNTWHQADFRLICATNRDLQAEEAKGNFRLDFYHRIACSRCHLPPLRERRADILPLARHFLRRATKNAAGLEFDPVVEEFLLTHNYPGNVRELHQLVQRILQRHVGPGPITAGAIPEDDRHAAMGLASRDWRDNGFQEALRRALAGGAGLQDIKEQTVKTVIEIALSDAEGNLQRAAIKLGITDRALQMRRAEQKKFSSDGKFSCANAVQWPSTTTGRDTHPTTGPSAS